MAYPLQIFDFQNPETKEKSDEFLLNMDSHITSMFGMVKPADNMKMHHKWDVGEVPKYLTEIGEESVKKILKNIKGDLKWTGSFNINGRKTGTIVKKNDDILYRIILHLGPPEVYHICGNGFNNEPVVLPNGWGLLCSPVSIDNIDIKVFGNPIRKYLKPELLQFVNKIRPRNYMRFTVVLNLLADGVDISEFDRDQLNPPTLEDVDNSE